jgi:hypothetical protein
MNAFVNLDGSPRGVAPSALVGGPFRLSDAHAVGISRDRLRGSAFRHPTRSVYVSAEIPANLELEASTWTLVLPESAAMFGTTAAAWYGLPVPSDDAFHVIVPAGSVVPRRRNGLVPHEGLRENEWCLERGLRVTTPERTWLDLAQILGRTDLVIAGDAMVSRGLTTVEGLQVVSATTRRRRGAVLSREAAALVRSGVDSPPETTLRLIIVDGGLPCPEPGLDIYDEGGGWIGRPDLSYVVVKLAIQYEGDVHRTSRRRWRADISRDEVLLDHGWDVVRVTGDDLHLPAALCHRIALRLDRQSRRLGVPFLR